MISKVFLLFIFVGCGFAKNDSELLSSSNGVNDKVDVENSTKEFLVRHSFSLDAHEHGKVDLERWRGEDCLRFCSILEAPRICYFHFVLEHYQVMGPACLDCFKGKPSDCLLSGCISADGVERAVMTINRQIPGPPIHVCKGDTIVVDVTNQMPGTGASIHWHGLHQRETPFMDGVPQITQCPIDASTTFRYAFNATESGTQFYHSHSGHHKVNGHFGALIIRDNFENDPNSHLYDYDFPDHTILAADWMHELAETLMPGLRSSGGILPINVLINGRGRFTNKKTKKSTKTPLEVFRVDKSATYRFRFINSASHVCPLQLQIEKHQLTVIASDSFPLKPEIVNTIVSTAGERYDFVLTADQPEGEYFVRIRAIGPCAGLHIEQFAVLTYASPAIPNIDLSVPSRAIPLYAKPFPTGINLNHPNATCNSAEKSRDLCISDLETYVEIEPEVLKSTFVDYQYILAFDNYRVDNALIYEEGNYDHFMNIGHDINLMGAINNISFTYPPFSLLTQPEEVSDSLFCDENNIPAHCIDKPQCPCIYRIKVSLNSTVELVIVDESAVIRSLNHPFHVHGYAFQVVGMGQHPLGIPLTRHMVKHMLLTRSLPVSRSNDQETSPLKDTVSIPSRGFAIIRFRADNPGFWFIHCHFDWHLAVGMALVLQVGEPEDMKTPPNNFPKCNNFIPSIYS